MKWTEERNVYKSKQWLNNNKVLNMKKQLVRKIKGQKEEERMEKILKTAQGGRALWIFEEESS